MDQNHLTGTEDAFVDIVSNTLGVIILLVLITLIFSVYKVNTSVRENVKVQTVDFESPSRLWLKPWQKKYIMLKKKMFRLDIAEVIKKIQKDFPKIPVKNTEGNDDRYMIKSATKQIRFKFLYKRIMDGDLNEYELQFTALPKYIEGLPVFNEHQLYQLVMQHGSQAHETGILYFYVYSSALNEFSAIFQELKKNNIPFKWELLEKESNYMNLYRDRVQFDRYDIGLY